MANARTNVINVTAMTPLEQSEVRADHIAHVGEVPFHRKVADGKRWSTVSGNDASDLRREARDCETRVLSRANVIERSRYYNVKVAAAGGLQTYRLSRELARRVRIARRGGLRFLDRKRGRLDRAINVGRAHEQQASCESALYRCIDDIGSADRIDLISLDGLLQRLCDRGLGSQMQNPVWIRGLDGSCYGLRVADVEVGGRHDDVKFSSQQSRLNDVLPDESTVSEDQ